MGKMVTYRETHTIPVYVHGALWPNSKHSAGREANESGRGQPAEEAHKVPMCQQSSYFIIYLRAEIGGWARWKERECVCVCVIGMRDEGEKEGFWVSESSWSFIHHTALVCVHVCESVCGCACMCVCDFLSFFFTQMPIFSTETKLQWDVTSARRPHSCLLLKDREKGSVWESAGMWCRVMPSSTHSTVWIMLYACNLISWMCHKSLCFTHSVHSN